MTFIVMGHVISGFQPSYVLIRMIWFTTHVEVVLAIRRYQFRRLKPQELSHNFLFVETKLSLITGKVFPKLGRCNTLQ